MFRLFLFASFLSLPLVYADFTQEVEQPLTQAFIPIGFDDNDSVQIVVAGKFKNSCFQMGTYSSLVDDAKKTIEIRVTAYEYGGRCLQVEVPFYHTVYLGLVGEVASYSVVDATSGKKLGALNIAKAPPSGTGTDADTYAPLLDAYLTPDKNGKDSLVLNGIFPDNCVQMERVDLLPYETVLVVLPKILRKDTGHCKTGEFPFRKTVPVTTVLPQRFLLHVRSMGGQAINKIIVNGRPQ